MWWLWAGVALAAVGFGAMWVALYGGRTMVTRARRFLGDATRSRGRK